MVQPTPIGLWLPSTHSLRVRQRTDTLHFDQFVNDLLTKLVTTQATALENLERFRIKTKNTYDKDINPKDFIVGEFVYLHAEEPTKLEERWLGP